ncbi:NAD-dependent epimerase [Sphingobacterium sp.]|uniref:NAD-dependent epimerase n=1 Tax=Sphingobacterium sp. TaxID=341027 RepID=UPI0028A6CED0|nr:NAD-dependent epimerase [Sphingobacterium sp.]
MKTILVTGAAGFIGFHLVRSLLEDGNIVVGLDNLNDYYDVSLKLDRLKELGVCDLDLSSETSISGCNSYEGRFTFVKLNLQDRVALPQLFESYQFDSVVNLAAQAGVRYSIENPASYIDSNIVGFLNILECCRHNKIAHLVYASSSSVYGENEKVPFSEDDVVDQPISLYAATKKSNELMAYTYSHLYDIPTTGLRFFTVYGPWGRPDMAPMLFANAITCGKSIKVFNEGHMSRDFTFIDDIISGIKIALVNPMSSNDSPPYQIFNIGNGSPVALFEFIETLEDSLGHIAEKIMMPMQDGDVPKTWADTKKLNDLGYKSTTVIKDGVAQFISWFKNYYKK